MDLNSTISSTNTNCAVEGRLRKSSQPPMPIKLNRDGETKGAYNIYPVCALGENKINNGFYSLAQWIITQKTVLIDGYAGVFWDIIQSGLQQEFAKESLTVNWINTTSSIKSPGEIEELIHPFLGPPDAVWGTKCLLELKDLFNLNAINSQAPDGHTDLNIIIGTGSALSNWDAPLIYIDLPKNELQFRMRAGSIFNLGANSPDEPFLMYKRSYFVDWVLLNQHKKSILNRISVVADGQWLNDINWMLMADLVEGLNKVSQSTIRVRPWFEPGAWGGQWIKEHIPGVKQEVVNYAWSFELIVPENGIVFESSGYLLEVSFDFLMFQNRAQVLGRHAAQFGDEFPIRFDFLDTYEGGNLSIQCHPRLKYIREVFGENITQDETYYILDCDNSAKVYLGFQENIDSAIFKAELEKSRDENTEITITDYVQSHPAKKHDLFLIPNGTVHSAGAGNLVLEISATPYIFTFKMYDWLRLDLDGNPRPINIDHAFNNLDFERKGSRVQQYLISKEAVIDKGENWQLVHLPTHQEHFYDVHRIEFDEEIAVETNNCCHVMMLVEGESVQVETADGSKQVYAFAETFIVPAAAGKYRLKNSGSSRAKVIKAFLK